MANELIQYDAMCAAIDAAYDLDEVRGIRDKAVALEHYFRISKNPEPERRACEIRIRAERKAGQMLKTIERARAGRPKTSPAGTITGHDPDYPNHPDNKKTLADLGVSRKESARMQKLADVPDDDFEAEMAGGQKPSASRLLNKDKPVDPMNPTALWIWGRLRDMERDGHFETNGKDLLSAMTDAMRSDTVRLAPIAIKWLKGLADDKRGKETPKGNRKNL